MAGRDYPTPEYVRQCLRYDDGKLFWFVRPTDHFPNGMTAKRWNKMYSGKEAGYVNYATNRKTYGFRRVAFRGYGQIRSSTLIWALHYGEWQNHLDHKDRNPMNDRIENLRPSNQTQNNGNMSIRIRNSSGYKGVSWHDQTNKWVARIRCNGVRMHLGLFSDPAEAHKVYMKAARELFGEFATDGRRSP